MVGCLAVAVAFGLPVALSNALLTASTTSAGQLVCTDL